MTLSSLVRPDLIFRGLPAGNRNEVLRVIADRLAETDAVSDADELYQELLRREELGSTGIGGGVAIPHCKLSGLSEVLVAVVTTEEGVDFAASDDGPVRLFFVVASPAEGPNLHLQALALISRWIKQEGNVESLLEAEGLDEVMGALISPALEAR